MVLLHRKWLRFMVINILRLNKMSKLLLGDDSAQEPVFSYLTQMLLMKSLRLLTVILNGMVSINDSVQSEDGEYSNE